MFHSAFHFEICPRCCLLTKFDSYVQFVLSSGLRPQRPNGSGRDKKNPNATACRVMRDSRGAFSFYDYACTRGTTTLVIYEGDISCTLPFIPPLFDTSLTYLIRNTMYFSFILLLFDLVTYGYHITSLNRSAID